MDYPQPISNYLSLTSLTLPEKKWVECVLFQKVFIEEKEKTELV
jgi:hypothetical protein